MRYEIIPSVYDLTHRFESLIIKYRATRGIFIRRGYETTTTVVETVSWIVPSIPSDEMTGYRRADGPLACFQTGRDIRVFNLSVAENRRGRRRRRARWARRNGQPDGGTSLFLRVYSYFSLI